MSKRMRLGRIAALGLPIIALTTLPAVATTGEAIELFKPDDGTYRTVDVTSSEQCTEICKADAQCRGAVTFQADITKPEAVCRLNNGGGANAVFPPTPPQPFNINVAVADLNAYRAEYGLQPVVLNDKLIEASRIHADDIASAGIISHEGTDGSTHGQRAHRVGYNYQIAGENVATGQKSWDEVFQAWKDSPGHNENLLRSDVSEFGIALTYEPSTTYSTYWSMLVAEPLDMSFLEAENVL